MAEEAQQADLYPFLKALEPKDVPLSKADIPEVEEILRVVSRIARRYWKRKIDKAVEFLIREIEAYERRYGAAAVDEIEVLRSKGSFDQSNALSEEASALLALIKDRLDCPFSDVEATAVKEAARDLLDTGAEILGFIPSHRSPKLPLRAQRELSLLLRGRAEFRGVELTEFLKGLLSSNAQRQALAAGGSARQQLQALLGSQWTSWGEQTVDAWAYRWHNIGRFEAGRRAGVEFWVARNPLDQRTTQFCRWVHGKAVRARRIEASLRTFYRAIDSGDVRALRSSWPLEDPGKSVARFRRIFANVGLPPYHFRCRTVIVPVRA